MSANTISMRTNFPKVVAKLNQVADDVGNKAMVRALNTTIDQGKIQMARNISQEFRITVGKAKARLDVRKASAKGGALRFEAVLEATRRGTGRSMNIIAFVGALPRRSKKGKLSQIKFQIKRGGGKKMLPGAFIGNKDRTMFIRTGDARLPIKPLNTIDVPRMFNARRINGAVRKVMLERFETNFNRELRVVLKGYVK
jgi:hypothetical protein